MRLSEVKSSDYMAIHYVGGRGTVIDLPIYEPNIDLAEQVSTTSCQRTLSSYTSSSSSARESLLVPLATALRK